MAQGIEVFTAGMRDALGRRGFVGTRRYWRRDSGPVPVHVYADRSRWGGEAVFDLGVRFGGGRIPMDRDGDDCVVQVSMSDYTDMRAWYDLSDRTQSQQLESDFFSVVIPLVDAVSGPRDVVTQLLDGTIRVIGGADPASRVLAASRAIRDYQLADLRPELERALHSAAQDAHGYARFAEVVEKWPENDPWLVSVLPTVHVPPQAVEREPTWLDRWRALRARRWSSW